MRRFLLPLLLVLGLPLAASAQITVTAPGVDFTAAHSWTALNTVTGLAIVTNNPTLTKQSPFWIYGPSTVGDSSFAVGVDHDGGADNNDGYIIYKSATPGTFPIAGFGKGFSGFTSLTLAGNAAFIMMGDGAGGTQTKTNWRGLTFHDADGNGSPMISGTGAGTGAGSALYLQCNAGSVACLQMMVGGTGYWQLSGTTGNWEPVTDNVSDLGSATKRTRDVYASRAFVSAGTGLAVANVGANSCGTSAASIAGGNNAFVITVGATAGTQCRVAFTVAAATEWDCTVTDSTTTIATRATPVDTTHTDFLGAFVAADKVTGVCFPR